MCIFQNSNAYILNNFNTVALVWHITECEVTWKMEPTTAESRSTVQGSVPALPTTMMPWVQDEQWLERDIFMRS